MKSSTFGDSRSQVVLVECWLFTILWGGAYAHGLHAQDYNHNGVADPEDIARGTSVDCDRDGVPDDLRMSSARAAFPSPIALRTARGVNARSLSKGASAPGDRLHPWRTASFVS